MSYIFISLLPDRSPFHRERHIVSTALGRSIGFADCVLQWTGQQPFYLHLFGSDPSVLRQRTFRTEDLRPVDATYLVHCDVKGTGVLTLNCVIRATSPKELSYRLARLGTSEVYLEREMPLFFLLLSNPHSSNNIRRRQDDIPPFLAITVR
jgi:hypothetical protein